MESKIKRYMELKLLESGIKDELSQLKNDVVSAVKSTTVIEGLGNLTPMTSRSLSVLNRFDLAEEIGIEVYISISKPTLTGLRTHADLDNLSEKNLIAIKTSNSVRFSPWV